MWKGRVNCIRYDLATIYNCRIRVLQVRVRYARGGMFHGTVRMIHEASRLLVLVRVATTVLVPARTIICNASTVRRYGCPRVLLMREYYKSYSYASPKSQGNITRTSTVRVPAHF